MTIPLHNFYFLLTNRYSTGLHTVADVYCLGCNERLGWFYVKAPDNAQKYKEGEGHLKYMYYLPLNI